jgi:hypothetical protein
MNLVENYGNIDAIMNQSTKSVLRVEQTSTGSKSTTGVKSGKREAEECRGSLA